MPANESCVKFKGENRYIVPQSAAHFHISSYHLLRINGRHCNCLELPEEAESLNDVVADRLPRFIKEPATSPVPAIKLDGFGKGTLPSLPLAHFRWKTLRASQVCVFRREVSKDCATRRCRLLHGEKGNAPKNGKSIKISQPRSMTFDGMFFSFEDDFVFLHRDENENRGQIASSSLSTAMTRFPGIYESRRNGKYLRIYF